MSVSYWESRLKLFVRIADSEQAYDAYVQGLIAGVEAMAIHKDGQLFCGVMQTPFQTMRGDILAASRLVKRSVF